MNEGNQEEVILWEYKWGRDDIDEMNRLGKRGWEAVGTNFSIIPAGVMAHSPKTRVLYKRRLGLKYPPETS